MFPVSTALGRRPPHSVGSYKEIRRAAPDWQLARVLVGETEEPDLRFVSTSAGGNGCHLFDHNFDGESGDISCRGMCSTLIEAAAAEGCKIARKARVHWNMSTSESARKT
eukprot:CAMPEP_0119405974 /NCGR_PEP_ID=MMETSP1335-20130426/481_1 /TAXON_ID=259385 /ORGANISM="Chrysoculter rhomboideus, Strain RCC1486" /LENGTH=109 /DNA_ID=CAMNT_0007430027 /DNA_START=99 /DNA_END=428 /DNA_ORIENTATION=-